MEWTFAHWFIVSYFSLCVFIVAFKLLVGTLKKNARAFIVGCIEALILVCLYKAATDLVAF